MTSPVRAGRRIRGLDAAERKAQRRVQLLESGLDLFAENGYPNTSIEQLCSQAYVGTKAFYELFDSKEDCYIALLRDVSERIERQVQAALGRASGGEHEITETLVDTFARALIDDPRIARVTFGTAAGISPEVEHQRRENRRWAASFVEGMWRQFDGPAIEHRGGSVGHEAVAERDHEGPASAAIRHRVDYHPMAVGLVGGLFELIAGWLLDVTEPGEGDVARLVGELTGFTHAVRRGLR